MIRLLLSALALAAGPAHAAAGDRGEAIYRRMLDPNGGPIVVAHRGCHAAAPLHRLPSAPENSLAALDHCLAMGIDVMETDVRQSRDGVLVMIHDATLDRTTDGKGPVEAMTLAELKTLHLRADLGGADAAPTDQRIATLDEMLARAKDGIVLNLDIKAAIYPEVIATVVRAGAQHRVIVKTTASTGTAPLAAMPPYDRVPFMPVLRFPRDEGQLVDAMRTQLAADRKPLGFELPKITPAILPLLAGMARKAGVRLWINTLWEGYVEGVGSDAEAARNPDRVWGRLFRSGISMIQTDYPEALTRFVPDTSPAR